MATRPSQTGGLGRDMVARIFPSAGDTARSMPGALPATAAGVALPRPWGPATNNASSVFTMAHT